MDVAIISSWDYGNIVISAHDHPDGAIISPCLHGNIIICSYDHHRSLRTSCLRGCSIVMVSGAGREAVRRKQYLMYITQCIVKSTNILGLVYLARKRTN
jgi:hypothetical protein